MLIFFFNFDTVDSSEANGIHIGSCFLDYFWHFWHGCVWLNWEWAFVIKCWRPEIGIKPTPGAASSDEVNSSPSSAAKNSSVNWVSIGSVNDLSPLRRQAITRTSAHLLSIGPFGTNFSEIRIGIQTFSSKKMRSKMSYAKWQPFCAGGNELTS